MVTGGRHVLIQVTLLNNLFSVIQFKNQLVSDRQPVPRPKKICAYLFIELELCGLQNTCIAYARKTVAVMGLCN
jgi:type II secretory pathway component PulC